jgi:hypothetical protein
MIFSTRGRQDVRRGETTGGGGLGADRVRILDRETDDVDAALNA